jgi:hypothetical protein
VSFAAKPRSKRKKNSLLSRLRGMGRRETVYPMRKHRKPASGRAPGGVETRYLGRTIRRMEDGRYATSVDWESHFDTLKEAKGFVRWWNGIYRNSRSNPAKFDACVKDIQARGGVANAYAVCTASLRRSNPEATAAELSEAFHGRPAHTVDEYADELHVHSVLTELGDLIEMTVETESGYGAELDFAKEGLKLASSEDGKQLFVQGRTDLDLGALHMSGSKWERDLMVIGRITSLVYRTAKEYDGGKVTDYIHASGEENVGGRHKRTTDVFPVLLYDLLNHELQIAGGQMEVKDVGIVR